MLTDFLVHNRDEQVLDNYLKLLAFGAQKTTSEHALIALKFEHANLQNQLLQERADHAALLDKHLDALLNSENTDVQAALIAKVQHYLVTKTTSEVKSLFKSGVDKMSALQNQLQQELTNNAALLDKGLDELLNSDNEHVKSNLQHNLATKTLSDVKSLFKPSVNKINALLEEKRK
jgi:tRNA splicing endonuclease